MQKYKLAFSSAWVSSSSSPSSSPPQSVGFLTTPWLVSPSLTIPPWLLPPSSLPLLFPWSWGPIYQLLILFLSPLLPSSVGLMLRSVDSLFRKGVMSWYITSWSEFELDFELVYSHFPFFFVRYLSRFYREIMFWEPTWPTWPHAIV